MPNGISNYDTNWDIFPIIHFIHALIDIIIERQIIKLHVVLKIIELYIFIYNYKYVNNKIIKLYIIIYYHR